MRSGIAVSETNITELNASSLEHIWRVLDLKGDKVLVGCIYRPPDSKQAVSDELRVTRSHVRARVQLYMV